MPPKLEYCFKLRGYFNQPDMGGAIKVKGGPTRTVIPISSGFVQGKDLDAEIIPGGADCLLMNTDTNTVHLDVRLNAKTKSQHSMFIYYTGVLKIDEQTQNIMNWTGDAQSTQYGDHEWYTSPIIETSDPDFKWVESSLFVAEGRWVIEDGKTAIEYEIYRVQPSR